MPRRGTEAWRTAEWGEACSTAKTTIAWIPIDPTYGQHKRVRLTVDRRAVEAFEAMARVIIRHRYVVDPTQTGAYNCRHIGSDPRRPWSSHAWATAVDINWRQNPDGKRLVSDMPKQMVDEICALACVDGTPVFRWGGDWDRDPDTNHTYYDAMHFEVWATPDELAAGPIADPHREHDEMVTDPADVKYFQRILARSYPERDGKGPPYDLDGEDSTGIIGPATAAAIRDWQSRRGLAVTGTLNLATVASLQSHANLAYVDRTVAIN